MVRKKQRINEPVYCLTSDIDWASEYCIADFIGLAQGFGITPTLFATHESPVVRAFHETHPNEVNLHPNFRVNSTHGRDEVSVINHLFKLYPGARAFRSHAFHDGSDILREMARRGIRYDSNLCLHLQPDIVPLCLGVPGVTRFPVFWEDDCHWLHTGGNWNFCDFADAFTTPGLKIINVHPFMIAANVPTAEHYASVKERIPTLSRDELEAVRHPGPGARTFLIDLIELVRRQNRRFHTLHELYKMFPIRDFLVSRAETEAVAATA